MAAAIGYLRVSGREQGNSGLGLAAQQHAISTFAQAKGWSIDAWHEDVQTGMGSDALSQRPGLRAALAAAKRIKGPLIVAKLDRLGRNSHFITGLMERKVSFIVTMFPDADPFMLHIYAAVAEQEGKAISTRTKEALARSTKKLGMAGKSKKAQRAIRALAMDAKQVAATRRAEAARAEIEFALKDGASLRTAAQTLNEREIESVMGVGRWYASSVLKAARRLGLR